MKFVYPAVFSQDRGGIGVVFPDFDGCVSQGNDLRQAFHFAREGLALHIFGLLEDGEKLPTPSRLDSVHLAPDETTALVEVELDDFEPDDLAFA